MLTRKTITAFESRAGETQREHTGLYEDVQITKQLQTFCDALFYTNVFPHKQYMTLQSKSIERTVIYRHFSFSFISTCLLR